jgi:hypothetical protein
LASLKVESTYSSLFIQELHNKVKLWFWHMRKKRERKSKKKRA